MAKMALCIQRADLVDLNRVLRYPVLTGSMLAIAPDQFLRLQTTLRDRADCETDPTALQLLPYVVITREDTGQIFVYSRGKGGAEERLHGNLSLGVGGHVDTDVPSEANVDSGLFNHLIQSAMRELEEEVGYAIADSDGFPLWEDELVYDDTNAVGQVHLGLLMYLDIADPSVLGDLEHGIIEGSQWLDLEELLKPFVYDRLENWSKIVVDRLSTQSMYSIAPK